MVITCNLCNHNPMVSLQLRTSRSPSDVRVSAVAEAAPSAPGAAAAREVQGARAASHPTPAWKRPRMFLLGFFVVNDGTCVVHSLVFSEYLVPTAFICISMLFYFGVATAC